MTIDDFDIWILTTTFPQSTERREYLWKCLADAGIDVHYLYVGKVFSKSPVTCAAPSHYGTGDSLADLVLHNGNRPWIYFEDDAVLRSDFKDVMNLHLSQLPDNWDVFVAGWHQTSPFYEVVFDEQRENIATVKDTFAGAQCLVFRGSAVFSQRLHDDIKSDQIYRDYRGVATDVGLGRWCKGNGYNLWISKKSFVGQHFPAICGQWDLGKFGLDYYQ
jgi:hypothetical protein